MSDPIKTDETKVEETAEAKTTTEIHTESGKPAVETTKTTVEPKTEE